ncbi:type IX secretion system protein PorD [Bacteroides sp.]
MLTMLGVFAIAAFPLMLSAQELDCKVTVNYSQIQGTNVQVFKTLETALTEFINERHWTQAQYEVNERIRCSMNLTVKSYNEAEGRWGCELIVQSTRPVYQSGYQSPVFMFKDNNVEFDYREFDPLELRDNQIDNNLTAVIAYYVYLMIGLDMDTMAPQGGTEILRAAESIVTAAQTLNEKGWKAFDDSRNRYAVITDYLDPGMEPLRQMMYDYHRKGMDEMVTNATRARAAITTSLGGLKQARDNKPMSSLPVIFTEIKKDEIINIYGGKSPASQNEREAVYQIVSNLNPSQNTLWDKIKSK